MLLLQPYGNGKPCVCCGSMMTRGMRTSHWEGGLGCRNKAKMCRYKSSEKENQLIVDKDGCITKSEILLASLGLWKMFLSFFSAETIGRNMPTPIRRFRGRQPLRRSSGLRAKHQCPSVSMKLYISQRNQIFAIFIHFRVRNSMALFSKPTCIKFRDI